MVILKYNALYFLDLNYLKKWTALHVQNRSCDFFLSKSSVFKIRTDWKWMLLLLVITILISWCTSARRTCLHTIWLLFWHHKTRKERASSESIYYLIWQWTLSLICRFKKQHEMVFAKKFVCLLQGKEWVPLCLSNRIPINARFPNCKEIFYWDKFQPKCPHRDLQ